MLAMSLLAFLHWMLARAAAHSKGFARLVEGHAAILGESGTVFERQMRRHNISDMDLQEALRKEGLADAAKTRQITLEPSGVITVLKAKST
jgi:uncharacterized membrane protein YcaP (DUF421 family)